MTRDNYAVRREGDRDRSKMKGRRAEEILSTEAPPPGVRTLLDFSDEISPVKTDVNEPLPEIPLVPCLERVIDRRVESISLTESESPKTKIIQGSTKGEKEKSYFRPTLNS